MGSVDDEFGDAVDLVRRVSAATGRRWRSSNDLGQLIEDEMYECEDDLAALGDRARNEVYDFGVEMREIVGDLSLFELAEVAHAVVYIAGDRWDKNVPTDVRYVFAGLATRAISTLREIALLLEQGYAFGARSRWRTLSEILVVARVLALGDRYTATRYREHRWIMLKEVRRKTGRFEWSSDLPTPEVMVGRLRRRFGKEFDGVYGWAARVSARELGVSQPRWHDLRRMARDHEHDTRVLYAHQAVHGADALGFLGAVDAGFGTFHAGASAHGVLEVARDSTRLFRQTIGSLFSLGLRFGDGRKPLILRGIVDEHAMTLEQSLGMRILAQDSEARARWASATMSVFSEGPDAFENDDGPSGE